MFYYFFTLFFFFTIFFVPPQKDAILFFFFWHVNGNSGPCDTVCARPFLSSGCGTANCLGWPIVWPLRHTTADELIKMLPDRCRWTSRVRASEVHRHPGTPAPGQHLSVDTEAAMHAGHAPARRVVASSAAAAAALRCAADRVRRARSAARRR